MANPINPLDAVKYAQLLAKDVWHAIEAERSAAQYQGYLENLENAGIESDLESLEIQAINERIDKLTELRTLLDWYSQYARSAIYLNRPEAKE